MQENYRYGQIDSLRGLAVLLMVMVHAAATWNPYTEPQTSVLAYTIAGLGGLAAPLFVTIFGWGLAKSKSTYNSLLKKALLLILLQIFVNLTSPHLFETFTPGVLSLFALLLLFRPTIIQASESRKNTTIFSIIMASLFVINNYLYKFQGDAIWENRIEYSSVIDMISHLFFTGTYPLFPWIIFAVIGASLGRSVTEGEKTLPRNNTIGLLMILGIVYCDITLTMSYFLDQIWAHPTRGEFLNFFPANYGFIIAALTGVIILWYLIERYNILLFSPSGKLSLSVYILHFIPLTILSDLDEQNEWSLTESSQAVAIYTTTWLIFTYFWINYFPRISVERLIRIITK